MEFEIKQAYDHIGAVRELFTEYTSWLGVDLSFQNYKEELEHLPDKYGLPGGRLYIALCGADAAGCVAMRPFDTKSCELKRLYVRPAFRGMGLGKALVMRIIEDAKSLGYDTLLLDTLDTLKPANAMYKSMGFVITEPYFFNPLPGIVYYCLELRQSSLASAHTLQKEADQ
jgi:GNAT superfamily N-acetyltransferase